MKTQIIHLEAHDDTLSVRDKMDWAQTPRVLLIWPEKEKVLRARLDLILLERYCSSHGSQMAIQTTDREVIYQAGEAGIPVFQNRRDAQLQPWGKSFRQFRRQEIQKYATDNIPEEPIERKETTPRRKLPLWTRITLFALGVFSVLSLAAFLLPEADITILPQIRQQTLSIPLQAQTGRDQVSLSGLVPARELIIEVEGQLSIPTTGTTSIPAEYARGEVTFTNLGDKGIFIPENTILSSSGEPAVLFKTLSAGTTPPQQGSEIVLEVEAYLPGESGNISADQITKINLDAGAELSVKNLSPTTGGTDINIPAATLVDRLRLGREMAYLLEQKAQEELKAILAEEDIPLMDRLQNLEMIEEEFSSSGNDPGEILWLDRSVQYLIYYISAEDINIFANDLVQAQYQDSTYQPDLNSIQVETTSLPIMTGSEDFIIEIQVTWTEKPEIKAEEISEWISARSVTEAQQILENKLDLAETPQISLHPVWWPRLPTMPFRIHIFQGGK